IRGVQPRSSSVSTTRQAYDHFTLAVAPTGASDVCVSCLPSLSARIQQRSTSATLHACATQPRGRNGGSASKISLIDPTHASLRCCSNPLSSLRTPSGFVPYTLIHASMNG